jgi:hypothetical protein
MRLPGSWFGGPHQPNKARASAARPRARSRRLPLSLETLEARNLPSPSFANPDGTGNIMADPTLAGAGTTVLGSSAPAGSETPQTAAVVPQHLALANQYVQDVAVPGAVNLYGLPASITYVNGVIHATTECAPFVRLVLGNAYASVTGAVLKGLTGSALPNSAQFYDAITAQNTYAQGTGTFAFHARPAASAIQPGDILAARYDSAHGSGHTMLVNAVTLVGSNLTGVFAGMAVNQYRVQVIDSASSPHTGTPSFPDTRGSQGQGIGSGYILLYENAQTGALVGWTWSMTQRTPYQGINPAGPQYRPIVAGYLSGPGIP